MPEALRNPLIDYIRTALCHPERLAHLSFDSPLLAIGFVGLVAFIATGLTSFIPWVASGPFALVFLGLIVAEFREYFQKEEPEHDSLPEEISEETSDETSESEEAVVFDDAVWVKPGRIWKEDWKYNLPLKKGQIATIEVNADEIVTVELFNSTQVTKMASLLGGLFYSTERSQTRKNVNINYEANRNGRWLVRIHHGNSVPLEVGVIISIE